MLHIPFKGIDFFHDTPWLRVPTQRLGTLKPDATHLRGGLLGGSGKPSKLAALAAARRKKEEEKKAVETQNITVSLLDRLGSKKSPQDQNQNTAAHGALEATPGNEAVKERRTISLRPKTKPEPQMQLEKTEECIAPSTLPEPGPDLNAQPSTFAETMFGPRLGGTRDMDRLTSLPVHRFSDQAFAGPSPDDAVLIAQSKGLRAG